MTHVYDCPNCGSDNIRRSREESHERICNNCGACWDIRDDDWNQAALKAKAQKQHGL